MKILHVINSLGGGGAEKQFVETVNRLNAEKYEISVCLASCTGVNFNKLDKSRLKQVYCLCKKDKWQYPHLVGRLRSIIRYTQPDVVHAWLCYASGLACLASSGLECRVVAGIRNSPASLKYEDVLMSLFDRVSFQIFTRLADVLLVNSRQVGSQILRRTGRSDSIHFIPNGIDISEFKTIRNKNSFPHHSSPCLLAAGRLQKQKGYSYLLCAIRKLKENCPDLTLLVAGEGSLQTELRTLTEDLGLKNQVDFLGFRTDIFDLMAEADVFVLPSLYEGMPNVIMEAMALKKPIVATSVDGVNELLADGKTGFLVPPADSTALAKAIERLLRDEDLACRLGRAAAKGVQKYSFENVIPQFESLYGILQKKGK
ncbi:MAG: glycosyltransferase [Planctomycetes bacterium]|nr:glycosyltransferase [Planctomycetota bacterium]